MLTSVKYLDISFLPKNGERGLQPLPPRNALDPIDAY